jgi:hypothetical protein
VPGQDHKPDEFSIPERDELTNRGEFTRAFGGKTEPAVAPDPSEEETQDTAPRSPGSLTQLIGGKPNKPSPSPTDSPGQPRSAIPNPPPPRPAVSFTSAFDGLNAFTRDPADLGSGDFPSEAGKQPRRDMTPVEPSGSFTRLFGTGEGVLTPSGTEECPHPLMARDPQHPGGRVPGFPQSTLPGYFVEPALPSNPQRTPAAGQGFERLVGQPHSESNPHATVVFNGPSSPQPEPAEPEGESAHTVIKKLSDLRSQKEASSIGNSLAPPWQPPQLTPPAMPQGPAPPSPRFPPATPTLGDKLVSFLPFLLALSMINFLGLLAVLIILFATRR